MGHQKSKPKKDFSCDKTQDQEAQQKRYNKKKGCGQGKKSFSEKTILAE
ncbi:hypothetical protein [Lactiplantibacillus plantarum]